MHFIHCCHNKVHSTCFLLQPFIKAYIDLQRVSAWLWLPHSESRRILNQADCKHLSVFVPALMKGFRRTRKWCSIEINLPAGFSTVRSSFWLFLHSTTWQFVRVKSAPGRPHWRQESPHLVSLKEAVPSWVYLLLKLLCLYFVHYRSKNYSVKVR